MSKRPTKKKPVARKRREQKPRGKSIRNTSKYRGVSWGSRQQRWLARVRWQGKTYYVGNFENENEAAKARDLKLAEIAGGIEKVHEDEFNFPPHWVKFIQEKDKKK